MYKSKTSVTFIDEENRRRDSSDSKVYFNPSQKYGHIQEVHPKRYAARILLVDGGMAYSGEWLPIKNPWQELIHDYGVLRPGLLVEVVYSGDQESQAEVLVIGLENEKIAEVQEAPTLDLGLYEIFTPGT